MRSRDSDPGLKTRELFQSSRPSLTSERSCLPEHQPSGLVHLDNAHLQVANKNPHPGLKPTPSPTAVGEGTMGLDRRGWAERWADRFLVLAMRGWFAAEEGLFDKLV